MGAAVIVVPVRPVGEMVAVLANMAASALAADHVETIELHDQLIPGQDPQGLGQIKPARHTATRVF